MIVVTAPTGNIGRRVTQNLLAGGEEIRVVVRDPAKLSDAVRDRVDVVQGSHGEAEVVNRAFAGAEAVFWLCPPDPSTTLEHSYVDFTRPAVEAIRRHGVERVVSITALGRGTKWQESAGLVTASIQMDDLLMGSGAAFRGLAMPSFMDNQLEQVDTISEGTLVGPIDADKKLPHTSARDMGATAAELLGDRSWSGQQEVPLLGPEDLSFDEIAAITAEVLGRAVHYRQVPFEAFKSQLLQGGMSESFAQGYVDMMKAKNEGMDCVADRASAQAGATTYRQWAQDELKPAVDGEG